ncbi:hypothetical protein BCR42DRAFT_415793 [Absidia repens]|uniref:sterol 3beta-glucosyltransferase n=1 Tax=Absidia repens TaxID=90262 RepID=A0A1X2IFZ9_9FUNG|nr:hypothetical protein BCR42DRAFT_415793 [Absidia repens]
MYLTDQNICFFAPLPSKDSAPKRSGYLSQKKHRASPLHSRHYFILEQCYFSWYHSAEHHYQLLGIIELKTVTNIRNSRRKPLAFTIITSAGKYSFVADSEISKKEWMDDLRRSVFMAKNDGNCVRIILPFSKAITISKASAFDFAEYIKVSISDLQQPSYDRYCYQETRSPLGDEDDYYFAFFPDINKAYNDIYESYERYRAMDSGYADRQIIPSADDINMFNEVDDNGSNGDDNEIQLDAACPITEVSSLATIGEQENDNTRPAATSYLMHAFTQVACPSSQIDPDTSNTFGDTDFKSGPLVHRLKRGSGQELLSKTFKRLSSGTRDLSNAVYTSTTSLLPSTLRESRNTILSTNLPSDTAPFSTYDNSGSRSKRIHRGSLNIFRHYAALPFQQLISNSSQQPQQPSKEGRATKKSLSLPRAPYLRQLVSPLISNWHRDTDQQGPKDKVDGLASTSIWLCSELCQQLGMDSLSSLSLSAEKNPSDDPFQETVNDELHKWFPMLGTSATVNAVYHAAVWRIIPYYGRLYFTQDYLCFHASVLAGHQKIVVPFKDIVDIRLLKNQGYHLLRGLGITTKDMNEEIFFEFLSTELRNSCYALVSLELQKNSSEMPYANESDSNDDELDFLPCNQRPPYAQLESPAENVNNHVAPPSEYIGPPILTQTPNVKQQRQSPYAPKKPLTITCLTIGSRGDVQPYIALCKQLQQDGGHHCRIASHGEYQSWVEAYGIEFRCIGGDPGELMRLCIENNFLSFSFIKAGYKLFYTWFNTLLESSWDAVQGTDVLIESPSSMVGIHMAENLEIPYFRSMPFPWTKTTKFPHPFAVSNLAGGRIYNDMTYLMIDMALWAGTSKPINRFRREKLGLAPTSLDQLQTWRIPYLYSFSPLVQPAPKDWPDYIHCTGYWFIDEKEQDSKDHWKPPQSLLSFLNLSNPSDSLVSDGDGRPSEDSETSTKDERPVVYIGFGSIIVSDPEAMSRVIVESVIEANVRAIICKGWSSRGSKSEHQLEETPTTMQVLQDHADSILMLDSVPHDWLFPLIQGVVHHGGSGTCAAGLKAGLPTVIKPFFGDQRFWGHKVEELGVGICMPKLTKAKLTESLLTITQDEVMITKAKLMGEAIRQENGTKTAMECLYRDMGLAKRTKQPLEPSLLSALSTSARLQGRLGQ